MSTILPDEISVEIIVKNTQPNTDPIEKLGPTQKEDLRKIYYTPGHIVGVQNLTIESQKIWEMTPWPSTKDNVKVYNPDDLSHGTTEYDNVAGGNSLVVFKSDVPLLVGLVGFMYGTPGKRVAAKTFKKEGDSGWWIYYTMPNTDYKAWQFSYATAFIELWEKTDHASKSSIVSGIVVAGIAGTDSAVPTGTGDDGTAITAGDFAFKATGPCIDDSVYEPTKNFLIYSETLMMTDFFCMNGSFRNIRVFNPHNETKEFRVSMIDLGPDFQTPYFGPGDYTS